MRQPGDAFRRIFFDSRFSGGIRMKKIQVGFLQGNFEKSAMGTPHRLIHRKYAAANIGIAANEISRIPTSQRKSGQ
jgi:hypothetical protein